MRYSLSSALTILVLFLTTPATAYALRGGFLFDDEGNISIFWLLALSLLLLVCLLRLAKLLLEQWNKYRLGKLVLPTPDILEPLSAPPDDTPPALAGTLLGEKSGARGVLATLIDLANRGAIVFEQRMKMSWPSDPIEFDERLAEFKARTKKGGLGKQCLTCGNCDVRHGYIEDGGRGDWCPHCKMSLQKMRSEYQHTLHLVDHSIVFSKLEGDILGAVFGSATIRSVEEFRNNFYRHLPGFRSKFYKEAAIRIREDRTSPSKTEVAAKWGGFKKYLAQIEDYGDLSAAQTQWERYLPYAIIFRVEQNFLGAFAKVDTPIPDWYRPSFISSHGKLCPLCGKRDVHHAYIEDGGRGDWCPHCKMSLQKMRSEGQYTVEEVPEENDRFPNTLQIFSAYLTAMIETIIEILASEPELESKPGAP